MNRAIGLLEGYVMVPVEYIEKLKEVTDADLTFSVTRPVQLSSILCSALYDDALHIKHATDVAYSVHCAVKAMDDAISDVLSHGKKPVKVLARLFDPAPSDSSTAPGNSVESQSPTATGDDAGETGEENGELNGESEEYKREESKGFLLSQIGELYRHIGLIPLQGHRDSARTALDRMTRELMHDGTEGNQAS
jgi:hypothetical protein